MDLATVGEAKDMYSKQKASPEKQEKLNMLIKLFWNLFLTWFSKCFENLIFLQISANKIFDPIFCFMLPVVVATCASVFCTLTCH